MILFTQTFPTILLFALFFLLLLSVFLLFTLLRVMRATQDERGGVYDAARVSVLLARVEEELRALTTLFSHPTRRGIMSERFLEDQLKAILPRKAFLLKPRLKNGAVPDAAIRTRGGLVCIDVKTPEASADDPSKLVRMVEKHARDVREKYVGREDTASYAFLYLPLHTLYLQLVEDEAGFRLAERLASEGVILTTPLLLPLHVQHVLAHEGDTREAFRKLNQVRQDLLQLDEELGTAEEHARRLYTKISSLRMRVHKLSHTLTLSVTDDEEEN